MAQVIVIMDEMELCLATRCVNELHQQLQVALNLTISGGISSSNSYFNTTAQVLIKQANDALYYSKQHEPATKLHERVSWAFDSSHKRGLAYRM